MCRRRPKVRPRIKLLSMLALLCALSPGLSLAAGVFDIDATQWQQPRSASMVKALPAVQSVMQGLLNAPNAQIVIRHRDDEEGTLWGSELRDWLISLGVKPAALRLEVMALSDAALQLEVIGTGGTAR